MVYTNNHKEKNSLYNEFPKVTEKKVKKEVSLGFTSKDFHYMFVSVKALFFLQIDNRKMILHFFFFIQLKKNIIKFIG